MDSDTEVLKIQILADYQHAQFTVYASLCFGLFVAWLIFMFTLLYEEIIPISLSLEFLVISVLTVFSPVTILFLYILRDYHSNLDRIDKLIQQVKEGKPLPSLRELRKTEGTLTKILTILRRYKSKS